jgi:hypothetical protein
MALICPQCKTKNRSAAKFCIECIGTLPTAFASADAPRTSAANSLFGFMRRAEQSQTPAGVSAAPAAAEATHAFSKGMWVSIAALSVALTVGATGWLVAGAGGWYLYTAGKAQVHPVRTDRSEAEPVPPHRLPRSKRRPWPRNHRPKRCNSRQRKRRIRFGRQASRHR